MQGLLQLPTGGDIQSDFTLPEGDDNGAVQAVNIQLLIGICQMRTRRTTANETCLRRLADGVMVD
jgi:hypothetical protein